MARTMTRRQTLASLALVCATGQRAFAQAVEEPDSWPDLARMFFDDAPIVEDNLVSFEAPERADDAALVPMSFSAKLPDGDPRRVVKLTLVIDQNPAPQAAAFTLGEKAGDAHLDPGAGQFLHQRSRCRGAQRRLAPYGDPLHQGVRRVLGAHGQEHG